MLMCVAPFFVKFLFCSGWYALTLAHTRVCGSCYSSTPRGTWKSISKGRRCGKQEIGRGGCLTELDLSEEDERDGGEHERRDEFEAGRGFCRTEQAYAEEIGGEDDREVDKRYERAEKRAEE